jgi:hypothetical protein
VVADTCASGIKLRGAFKKFNHGQLFVRRLAATHGELVEIEDAIQKAAAKHNEFLKEPRLSPIASLP